MVGRVEWVVGAEEKGVILDREGGVDDGVADGCGAEDVGVWGWMLEVVESDGEPYAVAGGFCGRLLEVVGVVEGEAEVDLID